MIFSKQDFNTIHENLEIIINLVNDNTTRKPKCMQYIEKMYHNAGICIAFGYKDMAQARKLLIQDWKAANDKHNGIGQYYFEKDDKANERKINNSLEIAIMTIDSIIKG